MQYDQRILIVDDEGTILTLIADALESQGYRVEKASSAEAALRACAQTEFALALIDLKIPGAMDGIGLLTEIRHQRPQIVLIVLTGYASLDSAIVALRQGAHDYLVKPIGMSQLIQSVQSGLAKKDEETRRQELIAHLEGTLHELKRTSAPSAVELPDRFVRTSTLTIDRQKRLVVCDDRPVALSASEFDLLDYLARHSDRVVTARELLQSVQGYKVEENEARPIVRVHIQRLRQKLKDNSTSPRYILNVRGKGYRFVG